MPYSKHTHSSVSMHIHVDKIENPVTDVDKIHNEVYNQVKEMFESTELTDKEQGNLKEIGENNLKIESNIEFQGVKGNFVTLDLGDSRKSYKIFFPDGTTEIGLDLFIESNKKEFKEIENYFKKRGINKPLIISLLYLLRDLIRTPFLKPEKSHESILNVDQEPGQYKFNQGEDNANLILITPAE